MLGGVPQFRRLVPRRATVASVQTSVVSGHELRMTEVCQLSRANHENMDDTRISKEQDRILLLL